jgi:LysR family hydrogen peroxide-inducible transcriptional activator
VASGVGLTVLPASAVPHKPKKNDLILYRPFTAPVPDRRVVLTWRKSFTRTAAIETLRSAILNSTLHGVKMLDAKPEALH